MPASHQASEFALFEYGPTDRAALADLKPLLEQYAEQLASIGGLVAGLATRSVRPWA